MSISLRRLTVPKKISHEITAERSGLIITINYDVSSEDRVNVIVENHVK